MEIRKVKVYKFSELEESVKERLLEEEKEHCYNEYCEFILGIDMKDVAENLLNEYFKGAKFKQVNYDLDYGQGSGAAIWFDIDLADINNKYQMLSVKDMEIINGIGYTTIEVGSNRNMCVDFDYQDYSGYEDNLENLQEKLDNMMDKFNDDVVFMNTQLEKDGYQLMENCVDEEWVTEHLNEQLYFDNGEVADNYILESEEK